MAFEKGHKLSGSRKGVANVATTKVREAISVFAAGNIDRLQIWLDKIAETDPKEAAKLYLATLEYYIPKLARSEMVGADGKDLIPDSVSINLVRPNAVKPS